MTLGTFTALLLEIGPERERESSSVRVLVNRGNKGFSSAPLASKEFFLSSFASGDE